jgi:glycosyltransferase involved in cell wall biosynthesis
MKGIIMAEISVIIPVYNRENTILEAISSVIEQDFQDFEVVVVDDGSIDNTLHIVESIQDKRIKVFQLSHNMGAQAARNFGIKTATSPWITFLDSDDIYLPNSLSLRLKKANSMGINVVHSECLVLNATSVKPKRFNTLPLEGNVYKQLLQRPGPTFPGLFVHRNALTEIGYLDESIRAYQEWDTSIRLAKTYKFGFVKEPCFIYRLGSKNSISKNSINSAQSYLQIINKHMDEIINQNGHKALSDHYSSIAMIYYHGSNFTEAIEWMGRSIELDKNNIKKISYQLIFHFMNRFRK